LRLLSPLQKLAGFQEKTQFQALLRLHQTFQVSQRVLAKDLAVGPVTINFCFQALNEKSIVKIHNFSQTKNKLHYSYLLMPAGVAEKLELTAEFLKRKVAEYKTLEAEIEALKSEISCLNGDLQ